MRTVSVIESGIQTTVQDYPGRRGMLAQGFFPAGPMDHFAHRASNLLVGNPESAATLEITLGNFRIRLDDDATVAIAGADAPLTIDGEEAALWESHLVPAGSEIAIGSDGMKGGGQRLRDAVRPRYTREWEVRAMRGPQAAPDYLTETDMETLFSRPWPIDRNSNRTGVRLESHRFEWARQSGGIAGGHPSNILDNSYPVGAININGDLPVILGPDGPTAGGFIVAATVVHADFWKIGQFRPVGDTVRFREISIDEATEAERALVETLSESSVEES